MLKVDTQGGRRPKETWRGVRSIVGVAALCASAAGASADPAASAPAPIPGADLAGVWEILGGARNLTSDPVLTAPALAEVERQTNLRKKGIVSDVSAKECIPPTMPTMTTFGVHELLVDRKKITWIIEYSNGLRWIFLDGRQHPPAEELRPTINGHSIGHWEGDVLVVDTVGFLDRAQVYVGRSGNESVFPGPQMRVVERIHLEDGGQTMINERVIHDPKNFAKPWKTTVRYKRRDDWEIGEILCHENNRADDY